MLSCRPIIESITEYLEGRLGVLASIGFAIHIRTCWQCRQYLEQIRTVVAAAARLPIEGPAQSVVENLRLSFANLDGGFVAEIEPPPET
jgi:hypothetical protein